MSHKFTIDDFTKALQNKNPEFDKALSEAGSVAGGDFFKFVSDLFDNTINSIEEDLKKPVAKRRVVKKRMRRGVGSY